MPASARCDKRPAARHQGGHAEIPDVRHPALEFCRPARRLLLSAKAHQDLHEVGQRDHRRAAQTSSQRHRYHLLEQTRRRNQVALAER